MRNRALTDIFEPGSTMKPFTIAAALEAGKVRPDTVIQTGAGHADDRHRDDPRRAPNGTLTVEQVIQKSCNIGAAKIALRCRRRRCGRCSPMPASARRRKTGFPGEVTGRLRPAKTWRPIEQATMAYGHGLSVNLFQLAHAYTMFANDGELKPATLLKTDGAVAGRPVLPPETARAVRHMLEMVDAARRHRAARRRCRAIASPARPAPRTSSKATATPNKYVVVVRRLRAGVRAAAHRRGDDRRARRPASYYGGDVAAPVFSTVMGAALRMLGVPPDAPRRQRDPAAARQRRSDEET